MRIEFSIPPTGIQQARERYNLATIGETELRYFPEGRIFVFVERPRDYVIIESGVGPPIATDRIVLMRSVNGWSLRETIQSGQPGRSAVRSPEADGTWRGKNV